ncbi:Glucose-methanol-choline (GMC) oxidoreductase:NAD binding site [plant metagenome]|uniref:Glucose-methanol-choline (GMC) oxidoreductase:NAD binding site n=1 Tax=plant metagenome TaxID=1297885 RepID=A0A484RLL8_9ZZZZ
MFLKPDSVPHGATLTADLCIVGAGAAGIAMALALRDAGLDVLLIESGGEKDDPRIQALYAGTVADERLHSPLDRYRQRRFGGSTTIWGGRCMPFDAIDFAPRDYMAHSGWPIGLGDLLPYYPQANRLCEAGAYAYTAEQAFDRPMRPMLDGFDSTSFSTDTLERFSCPTHFGHRYHRRLENSAVRVLQGYSVCNLALSETGSHIVGAQARTLDGRQITIAARCYTLAMGGLETTRLLLNSAGAGGQSLGNAHDVLGRYYMCHLAGTIGTLSIDAAERVWHGYERADDGVYCRRRLALSAAAQQRLEVGNFIARLHHPRITDPAHRTGPLSMLYLAKYFIPYEYGKRLHGEESLTPGATLQHVRNVVADAGGIAKFLTHWVRHRTLAARKFPSVIVHPRAPRYSLDFHAEQEPNAESRVTLGDGLDALGMRRLHVDWRYTGRDVHTVKAALAEFAQELEKWGHARFDYDPDSVEHEMTRYGAYGGHHIGTARMGNDPRDSVVDAHCRLHEADNLYLAGSAVFPTSSQANPTLTIVAMALRLADHLKGRLAARPA